MSTGNRELDEILEWLATKHRSRLKGGDAHKLRYIGRLMQSGIAELQRARRLLGDLVEKVERRAEREERATGRDGDPGTH